MNKKLIFSKHHHTTIITIPIILTFMFCGIFLTDITSIFLLYLKNFIAYHFGWLYIFAVSIILIFIIFLACSKYGKIKLGAQHTTPQFSYLAWIAMLFSAGLATGLVFWGIGEPITHFEIGRAHV